MLANTIVLVGSFALLFIISPNVAANCDFLNEVSPFIGSGGPAYGYGGINPGGQYPFAPLRLGPDSNNNFVSDIGFRHFSGYNYADKYIRAFSHTHLVGAGVNDLGNFGIMPFNKESATMKSDIQEGAHFWWSSFDKATETASPGQYNVYLNDPGVNVNLLAIGTHAGIHRYTWDKLESRKTPGLIIDICHAAKLSENDKFQESSCLEGNIVIDKDAQSFTGTIHFKGSLSHNIMVYIYGEIVPSSDDVSVSDWNVCNALYPTAECRNDVTEATGTDGILFSATSFALKSGGSFGADRQTLEVDVRVGLSFISTDLARSNLRDALADTSDFNKLAQRTRSEWCNALSFLSVDSLDGDKDMRAILYSAAYRSLMSPTRYTEQGGLYLGVDKQIHNVTAERFALYGPEPPSSSLMGAFYSDLSLWDTFRSQQPLLLLLDEELAVGVLRSMAEITAQQGVFPRWVLASNEASCMVGNHGSSMVLEAIQSGLAKYVDVSTIQKALLRQSTEPVPVNGRKDLEHYLSEGYVSVEADDKAAVLTLTNAFDDYLLAGISQHVGDTAAARQAQLRSYNYRNVWSRKRQFVCPKSVSGNFSCPRTAVGVQAWNYFTEGDAWHYTWFVPHDPKGLVGLFPTPSSFNDALLSFFEKHVPFHEKLGSAAPNPYFWAGNEHDALAPWLFNYGPNCTNTQYWTRRATHMHFSATPHGIPGNDDYGAMSSWVLFASLGFFPQAGSTRYLIGSPRVDRASLTLRRMGGKTSLLDIITYNNSPDNVFVAKLLVNGVELKEPFVERSVLVAGAKLEFFMQSEPTSGLCA